MSLVQLDKVSFSYGVEAVLTEISLAVEERARIGIVGPNGCGKSTLLRIIAGELHADGGTLHKKRGLALAYLPQNPKQNYSGSVYEIALSAANPLLKMREEMSELEKRMAEDPRSQERWAEIRKIYEAKDGDNLERNAEKFLQKFGFGAQDLNKPVEALSGGEANRLALCYTLLSAPELLLLDEPTNHLDLMAQEELEGFVKSFNGAVVAVSHDRSYLQNCCSRIVEINRGRAALYSGPYEKYREVRAERLEFEWKAYLKQQEEIEKTEEFIRRNIAGQNTKQAQGRRKHLERLDRLEKPQELENNLRFDFAGMGEVERPNKEIFICEELAKSFEERTLFSRVNLTLYRGQKVGLIGANGSGKTTLINIIRGLLLPDEGKIRRGEHVRMGVFEQDSSALNPQKTLLEELYEAMRERLNYLKGVDDSPPETLKLYGLSNVKEETLRSYAGRFLFSGDDVFKKTSSFSGGEQNRIRLMSLLIKPFNFLILDEPTNHLDLPAREALEAALRAYPGTLLIVSHDRYFLDAVCDSLWAIEEGGATSFDGNYSRFLAERGGFKREEAKEEDAEKERRKDFYQQRKQRQRLIEKLRRQVKETEDKTLEIERAIKDTEAELEGANAADWQRVAALVERKRDLEIELETAIDLWHTLDAELEETIKLDL